MAETYIPEGNPNPPNNVDLLDIIKAFNSDTNKEFPTRVIDIKNLLSDHVEPTFEHIRDSPYTNEELGAALTELTKQTLLNKVEIIYIKHLIALLTFELIESGFNINEKELQENLKIYLKYK